MSYIPGKMTTEERHRAEWRVWKSMQMLRLYKEEGEGTEEWAAKHLRIVINWNRLLLEDILIKTRVWKDAAVAKEAEESGS